MVPLIDAIYYARKVIIEKCFRGKWKVNFLENCLLRLSTPGVSKLRPAAGSGPTRSLIRPAVLFPKILTWDEKQRMTLEITLFSRFNHASKLFQSLNAE